MQLAATVLLFLAGLYLIIRGGNWFLDGAVWLAQRLGVPRFLIGATVVSLATTLPELTVSVTGALRGQTELAVGNAVGSVTANLGLILGLCALCLPTAVSRRQFAPKAVLMVLGAAVLAVLCRDGALAALPALALLGVFLLGLAQSLWEARAGRAADGPSAAAGAGRGAMALRFCGGLAGILIGSQLLIRCGSALARLLGVPEAVIGVTLVAVGTSLPELVTALTAIARREAALSVGNILGANLIDLTLILPVCALLSGGEVPIGRQTTALDLPVCLTLCLAAVLPPLAAGRLSRWQGAVLLGLYAAYAAVLVC